MFFLRQCVHVNWIETCFGICSKIKNMNLQCKDAQEPGPKSGTSPIITTFGTVVSPPPAYSFIFVQYSIFLSYKAALNLFLLRWKWQRPPAASQDCDVTHPRRQCSPDGTWKDTTPGPGSWFMCTEAVGHYNAQFMLSFPLPNRVNESRGLFFSNLHKKQKENTSGIYLDLWCFHKAKLSPIESEKIT